MTDRLEQALDAGYLGLSIPDDPTLFGRTLHAQAATGSGGATITLTPPTELTF